MRRCFSISPRGCAAWPSSGERLSVAYYNEHDQVAAEWLRNLVAAGHIAPGDIDERDIRDVHPDDLRPYAQCHFFAGVGVWSYALRRAGWPDDRPVWTGSCPCQPFSAAGKGLGFDDERHLWPAWYWLIGERRPAIVFGEQVASSAVDPWIDLVQADVEALDYAYGCVPFPSAGVGAPHIRDRAYWMAYAYGRARRERRAHVREGADGSDAQSWAGSGGSGMSGRLADTDSRQRGGLAIVRGLERDGQDAGRSQGSGEPESRGAVRGMADTYVDGFQRRTVETVFGAGRRQKGDAPGRSGTPLARRLADTHINGCAPESNCAVLDDEHHVEPRGGAPEGQPHAGSTNGFWRAADWLLCRDGKWRPVESGTFPLVDGSAGRMGRVRADQARLAALRPRKDQGSRQGRLRGYGNAINAEAAVAWIEACRGVIG
ncbi:DNA cytosine methyltransferase [Burkholderia pseudomallei]|uniref:DNA cytosine methyltransferase n=1 Tax=Burkholderia pseudomallei TaxID=28450 RepID=UPI000F096A4A|nr:DNA cytosine methyltransferase [Burkholderia pseudomallei]